MRSKAEAKERKTSDEQKQNARGDQKVKTSTLVCSSLIAAVVLS